VTRLTQSVALACGTAGAFVDVSTYADLAQGASRSWGRQSEFEDTAPGAFTFTLDNADGRFNPGSTLLATPVTEGMQVCWDLGGRLVAGTILAIEPSFPEAESAWAQVTVTCDDMLGNAARHEISGTLRDSLDAASGLLYRWSFDDATGSTFAIANPTDVPSIVRDPSSNDGTFTLGVTESPLPDSPVAAISVTGSGTEILITNGLFPPFLYPTDTVGAWGFWWASPTNGELIVDIDIRAFSASAHTERLRIFCGNAGRISMSAGFITAVNGPDVAAKTAYYISVGSTATRAAGVWTLVFELFVDGVSYGTSTWSDSVITSLTDADKTPTRVKILTGQIAAYTNYISRLSHSIDPIRDFTAYMDLDAAETIALLALTATEVALDSIPALSTALLATSVGEFSGSTLDGINDVIRAEQGAVYSATTGTLTAPVEKVTVRARDRVAAVDYTFNVETEASGGTDFIRDITNMVQTVTVDGPETSATYTDTTLTARVGSKNTSESLPLRDYVDLYTWATDRVTRGANVNLRAASLTIDALTTPTDRTADLLALIPGDRIQATGLPASLGFTTWDGWLLGVEEAHSLTEHTFTLYLQPVLPDPIILDTDLLAAGDAVTLTSNINSSVTSISMTSTGGLWTTGADLPQVIRIGSECMTLSAVSGASSPQTGTVARGATDPVTGLATTAAAQVAGAQIELADYGVLAF
jgi:hypothetical protein